VSYDTLKAERAMDHPLHSVDTEQDNDGDGTGAVAA
jgi:hypothetical protein